MNESPSGPDIGIVILAIGNVIAIALLLSGDISRIATVTSAWIFMLDMMYAAILIVYGLLPAIPMGTRSLLCGAHQFLWHPFTVFLGWKELYGWPNWKECVCIFVHDWGYWGCPNMEGSEGERHPELAAKIASRYLDGKTWSIDSDEVWPNLNAVMPKDTYRHLCLFHSRTYAKRWSTFPSKLCWADKLSIRWEPWWVYLPRVWLTGEIRDYRAEAERAGLVDPKATDREWHRWARIRMIQKAMAQDERPPYTEGS